MSIQKCLDLLRKERPKKRMSDRVLGIRVAILIEVLQNPHPDATEQYARLKAALLCGSRRKQ